MEKVPVILGVGQKAWSGDGRGTCLRDRYNVNVLVPSIYEGRPTKCRMRSTRGGAILCVAPLFFWGEGVAVLLQVVSVLAPNELDGLD